MVRCTPRGSKEMLLVATVLLVGAIVGCRKGEESKPVRPKPPAVTVDRENPEQTIFEQLRSGAFQIAGVGGTVEEALTKSRALDVKGDPQLAAAMGEFLDALDSVGATLAEHTTEPAEPAKSDPEFAKMDERRLSAISAANDALHELEDASGILDTLSQDPALANRPEVAEILGLLRLGMDDLQEAIRSLGGVVEQVAAS